MLTMLRMIGVAVFGSGILLVICRTVFKLIVHKRETSRKKTQKFKDIV